MLTVDHFKRPFINDVLDSLKVVDELFDQDFNECQTKNVKTFTV